MSMIQATICDGIKQVICNQSNELKYSFVPIANLDDYNYFAKEHFKVVIKDLVLDTVKYPAPKSLFHSKSQETTLYPELVSVIDKITNDINICTKQNNFPMILALRSTPGSDPDYHMDDAYNELVFTYALKGEGTRILPKDHFLYQQKLESNMIFREDNLDQVVPDQAPHGFAALFIGATTIHAEPQKVEDGRVVIVGRMHVGSLYESTCSESSSFYE